MPKPIIESAMAPKQKDVPWGNSVMNWKCFILHINEFYADQSD